MLILKRHVGETIMIGGNIEIKILSINGKNVRIGTEAPRGVPVHRKEIWLKKKAEQGFSPDCISMVDLTM